MLYHSGKHLLLLIPSDVVLNYLLSHKELTTVGFVKVKLICPVMLYCDLHGPLLLDALCTNDDLSERQPV